MPSTTLISWIASAAIAIGGVASAGETKAVLGWAAMIDAARDNADLAARRNELVATAREVTAEPIVKRVFRYEDVGKFRTWLDGRARALEGCPRQQWFALAMADFAACGTINRELPLLAVAYRLTGEEAFKARIVAQLEETAGWSPLQRPGYTLYTPSPEPVSPEFNDGNWLATGLGVRALADVLEIMPDGSLPEPLVGKIHALLRLEVAGVADDWRLRRSWFVRANNPRTNQWVLPTEGLIRACLVLGREKYPEQYELGVGNLIAALDAQGTEGEFHEGIGYANFTVDSMLHAAHAMAVDGDRRALDHAFLRRFPTWMAEHLQPGRLRVNCFDAGGAKTPPTDEGFRGLLSLFVLLMDDPVARWTLDCQFSGPSDDHVGLLAGATLGPQREPPCFAAFDGARRVNWRESWADDASGVWVRGGHPLDGHDHYDRGHVNFIHHGKPILIEAGTPSYDNPRIDTAYSSVVGHNVLEIPGSSTRKAPAPIEVRRLDADGGEVVVDSTAGYATVQRWERKVRWTATGVDIVDAVQFPPDKPNRAVFRWHLAARDEATISGGSTRFVIRWEDARITLESSVPITVGMEMLPDNTVNLGEKAGTDYLHTCLVVRAADACDAWTLTTSVVGRHHLKGTESREPSKSR